MSRKSKGECTCKIVAQNERGMLGQVRDSVYWGVKYCGDGGQVEKMFRFPRKLFEEKEYGMQMHVKGRNPKIGFRLYCEPDKERGIIVIGHCGHHLETAGTARRAVNK